MTGCASEQAGKRYRHQLRGFTLVEVITVVVILSLVAVVGTNFIVNATESYQRTQTRANLVNTARQALERMSRQLRSALPYSVRITNGGNCVEFMPIAGGGFYQNPVPDQANNAPAHTSIDTSPHSVDFGSDEFVSIGAMSPDELYGGSPESMANVTGRTSTQVNFPSRVWQRNSIARRFYLLDAPQAFCLFGNQLRFYPDQNPVAGQVDAGSDFDLLALNAQPQGIPFALSPASNDRNVVLNWSMVFTEGGESVDFEQEVLIRNVP